MVKEVAVTVNWVDDELQVVLTLVRVNSNLQHVIKVSGTFYSASPAAGFNVSIS